MLRQNNKGFTLLELIVVIAIIGILSVLSTSFISLAFSERASEAADVVHSLMSECKTASLSGRKDPKLTIEYDATTSSYKAVFVAGEGSQQSTQSEVLGDGRIEVSWIDEDGTETTLTEDMEITFDRGTGKMTLKLGTTNVTNSIKKISFVGGNRIYDIEVVPSTGYFVL